MKVCPVDGGPSGSGFGNLIGPIHFHQARMPIPGKSGNDRKGGGQLEAAAGEVISPRLWHFGHWNTCSIVPSLARNSDRDQDIGRWQDLQVGGPSSRSIERLSASIGARAPTGTNLIARSKSVAMKFGHSRIQIRTQGVKCGQHRGPVLAEIGHSRKRIRPLLPANRFDE